MFNNKLIEILYPKKIDDIIGFSKIIQGDGIFAKMIKHNYIFSFILYGDPGIGKTSLVNVIANHLNEYCKIYINAAQDTKKELNLILEKINENKKIIIIIDEIHSMHKNNQDFLLKCLEQTNVFIFATTTENPYISINPALRSRLHIIEMKKDSNSILDDLFLKIQNLDLNNKYSKNDIEKILSFSQYDIRNALNTLDLIDHLYNIHEIDDNFLNKLGILANYNSGKHTNELHDLKSALQKSIRGSDVDASLYYLGVLIKFNDLKILTRRIKIIAYEDIGLANPNLCMRVSIGCQSALEVGFPEASLILAPLIIEMALSPKSNSATESIQSVLEYLHDNPIVDIPNYLKDSHYLDSKEITGCKYLYPHNFPNHYVKQQYLSNNVNKKFYNYDNSNENENKLNNNFKVWTRKTKE